MLAELKHFNGTLRFQGLRVWTSTNEQSVYQRSYPQTVWRRNSIQVSFPNLSKWNLCTFRTSVGRVKNPNRPGG